MSNRLEIAVLPVFSSGTRLLPLTYGIPKELLPLGRYTLLHHAMKEAVMAGIKEFIFLTSRSTSLRPYLLDSGSKDTLRSLAFYSSKYPEQYRDTNCVTKEWFGLLDRVVSFIPQRTDMTGGLASAIASVERVVAGRPFAFFLPDDFIQNPKSGMSALLKVWNREHGWVISLISIRPSQIGEFGVVKAVPKEAGVWAIVRAKEKRKVKGEGKTFGIVGRYIFDHNVFRLIRETQRRVMQENSQSGFHITEAINQFAKAGKVNGVTVSGPYFHVGTIQGYFDAWRNVLG